MHIDPHVQFPSSIIQLNLQVSPQQVYINCAPSHLHSLSYYHTCAHTRTHTTLSPQTPAHPDKFFVCIFERNAQNKVILVKTQKAGPVNTQLYNVVQSVPVSPPLEILPGM